MGALVKDQDNHNEQFDVSTHFKFGENWADYAQHITDEDITRAQEGVARLIGAQDLAEKRVLDIGCGSGLHALAFLKVGAAHVRCIDIDPVSVKTAQAVLTRYAQDDRWDAQVHNILDEAPLSDELYDLVYSWGVLHHTGDLWRAVNHAVQRVADGGLFAIALYKTTPLCGFWAKEKRFYTRAPQVIRRLMDGVYAAGYCLGLIAQGTNPVRYIREYPRDRGMRFMTDVRDWLGGYPYQSALAHEVEAFMNERGFTLERSLNTQKTKAFGLFGTGCAEYVFKKM